MTTRTRRFVIASLLVLVLGLGAGFAAYYLGVSTDGLSAQSGQAGLQLVPAEATFVGYVNMQAVMASPLGQRIDRATPVGPQGQQEFEIATGIDLHRDIDSLIAYLVPAGEGQSAEAGGAVLARGRFDPSKIEALMRDHGAAVEDYKGRRIIVAERPAAADQIVGAASGREAVAVAFVEPGLAGIGSPRLVRGMLDRKDGSAGAAGGSIMTLARSMEGGDLWAVGRFDVLTQQTPLPPSIASQFPPINWLTVSARVDTGLRGVLRAETRDEESADKLREMVSGFIMLMKLQAPKDAGTQSFLQSLQLEGTGSTVALSFDAPVEVLDLVSPPAQPSDPAAGR